MLAVCSCLEVVNCRNRWLLGRAQCFYLPDRSALGLRKVVLIKHVDWGLKLFHLESISHVAPVLIVERGSWGLLYLVIGKGLHILMNYNWFDRLIDNMIGSHAPLAIRIDTPLSSVVNLTMRGVISLISLILP